MTTTFVLILTIIVNGPAVTSVPGFETDAACHAAGELWVQSTKGGGMVSPKVSFVCAGQEK
jgi:hypothetical protein